MLFPICWEDGTLLTLAVSVLSILCPVVPHLAQYDLQSLMYQSSFTIPNVSSNQDHIIIILSTVADPLEFYITILLHECMY